uniref:Uncharacterized protein n=1 Tax=Fagus sylvatica TaxID=28930 RepID=A0A2N9FLG3_FAGSY
MRFESPPPAKEDHVELHQISHRHIKVPESSETSPDLVRSRQI